MLAVVLRGGAQKVEGSARAVVGGVTRTVLGGTVSEGTREEIARGFEGAVRDFFGGVARRIDEMEKKRRG